MEILSFSPYHLSLVLNLNSPINLPKLAAFKEEWAQNAYLYFQEVIVNNFASALNLH
jgi:hypothetical protein